MKELCFRQTKRKHVAARRDDDALHKAELAIEGDALRRCQRLATLVEHRNRFASVRAEPGIVLGIDCGPKGATLHAAAGKAGRQRRKGFSVGAELGGIPLPQLVLPLPTNCEVVANPEITFTVERRSTRIRKGSPLLKSILVQCALGGDTNQRLLSPGSNLLPWWFATCSRDEIPVLPSRR